MKKEYYSRPEVARRYDAWRFGSAGGRYVDEREISVVLRLMGHLSREARVLDVPIGTGRAAMALVDAGFVRVEGADFSPAMLELARERCGDSVKLCREDALATSYPDAAFDCIVSLRFLFHHPDVSPLLREFARVLRPGGTLVVVNALRWSPRSVAPLVQRALGGRVWTLSDRDARREFEAAGFGVRARESMLLVPSLVYRFLPSFALGPLDRLEQALPSALCTKTFWRLEKPLP